MYVTSHVVDPLTVPAHVRDFGGFGGKFLMPTFARRAAGQTGTMHICDGGAGEYYCAVLDGGSWTWGAKPGSTNTLGVGGALDSSTLGDLGLSVETEADDGASDVHAMVGNWFNA